MMDAKKIIFILDEPKYSRADLARLCRISPEKFDAVFDYGLLYPLAVAGRNESMDNERACQLLRETPHVFIVLVGSAVANAFMVSDMPNFKPFPLSFDEGDQKTGKQVRAAMKVVGPSNRKWYQKPANLRLAMHTMSDLVQISGGTPMSETDIVRTFEVVEALGEDLNYWTKKILGELKDNYSQGKIIDKVDMVQLMQSYANDVEFKERKSA